MPGAVGGGGKVVLVGGGLEGREGWGPGNGPQRVDWAEWACGGGGGEVWCCRKRWADGEPS